MPRTVPEILADLDKLTDEEVVQEIGHIERVRAMLQANDRAADVSSCDQCLAELYAKNAPTTRPPDPEDEPVPVEDLPPDVEDDLEDVPSEPEPEPDVEQVKYDPPATLKAARVIAAEAGVDLGAVQGRMTLAKARAVLEDAGVI